MSKKDFGKVKLYFFGTSSGSHPIRGRHHAALALEYNNIITWLDAGENCSHMACEMGVDLMKVKNVIISHPDSDHTFGLPGLLMDFLEVERCLKRERPYRVTVYDPVPKQVETIDAFLQPNGLGIKRAPWYDIAGIKDGLLFEDGGIKVEARHNKHLGVPADGKSWRSFSFRISAGDKTIIYAGDYDSLDDFGDWITTKKQPADVLMIETGHNYANDIARELRERKTTVNDLIYVHHGLSICDQPQQELEKVEKEWGKSVIFSCDGMVVVL